MGMAGILFGILFLSLFIGVPIAISLGVAASLTMMLTNNAQYLASIPTRMFTQLDSFTLMAVPADTAADVVTSVSIDTTVDVVTGMQWHIHGKNL